MMKAKAWPPVIAKLAVLIQDKLGGPILDCVNVNKYSGPQSHLRFHSDNEKLFGPVGTDKTIVSLSFGASRMFQIKPLGTPDADIEEVSLENGDLLTMEGQMQDTHLHRVPPSDSECGPRWNLTFRTYVPTSTSPQLPKLTKHVKPNQDEDEHDDEDDDDHDVNNSNHPPGMNLNNGNCGNFKSVLKLQGTPATERGKRKQNRNPTLNILASNINSFSETAKKYLFPDETSFKYSIFLLSELHKLHTIDVQSSFAQNGYNA